MENNKLLGLQYIENIISDNSAVGYANEMLRLEEENCVLHILNTSTGETTEKKVSYSEYMRQTWNNSEDATLTDCETASFLSKLNQYCKYVSIYHGFYINGSKFLLDKKDKIVYFLYERQIKRIGKTQYSKFYTHYNPLNKTIIEVSINADYINNSDNYEFYTNASKAIEELNNIIKAK